MKLIIAGGRDYSFSRNDYTRLEAIEDISEVVCGGASGADYAGKLWAFSQGIPVELMPADWETHGKAAGPIRNRQMAAYADAVALFSGGRGTDSMYREAEKAGLKIFDWRQSDE